MLYIEEAKSGNPEAIRAMGLRAHIIGELYDKLTSY